MYVQPTISYDNIISRCIVFYTSGLIYIANATRHRVVTTAFYIVILSSCLQPDVQKIESDWTFDNFTSLWRRRLWIIKIYSNISSRSSNEDCKHYKITIIILWIYSYDFCCMLSCIFFSRNLALCSFIPLFTLLAYMQKNVTH